MISDEKGFGRCRGLFHYPKIDVQRLRTTTKNLRRASNPTEIRTGYPENTSLQRYHYINLLRKFH
jgi:hypothetical protein